MKRAATILLALLLLPVIAAQITEQTTDITISPNDVVTETITLTINNEEPYDSITYNLEQPPLAVRTDETYSLNETTLTIHKNLPPGTHTITFTLIIDDIITTTRNHHTLGLRLTPTTPQTLTVTLPAGATLQDTSVPISPRPDTISSDGTHIILTWEAQGTTDLIIRYNTPSNYWPIIAGLLIIIAGLGYSLLTRKKEKKIALHTTLTQDEQQVLTLIGSGVARQDRIGETLGWNKSKLSKVIRKLEEKEAIDKTPHFKTNVLAIKKHWR